MQHTRDQMQEAFKQGERHNYRPSFFKSFNRWYNENFLDKEKCKSCNHCENTVANRKVCTECVEFCKYQRA